MIAWKGGVVPCGACGGQAVSGFGDVGVPDGYETEGSSAWRGRWVGGIRKTKAKFMSSCVEASGYVLWSIDCDTFHRRLRM